MAVTEPLAVAVDGAPPPAAVAFAQQAFQDPATRDMMKRHATEVGGHAAMLAKHYGHQGVLAFGDYIQQGPKGVSTLCFMGGIATNVVGIMYVVGFLKAITDPLHYIIYVYVFVFGLATTCLEADPDRIGMMPTPFDKLAGPLTRGQAWLHAEVRILTQLRGRGVFYLYQGTLMATQCVVCLLFLVGLFNALMGALCIAMSFGVKPDFEYLAASAGMTDGVKYSKVYDQEAAENQTIAAGAPPTASTKQSFQPVTARDQVYWSSVSSTVSINAEFRRAEEAWSQGKENLAGKTSRALSALHNQATTGDCDTKKPSGLFNGHAKEQWRLWNDLKGISCDDAKVMFIEKLQKENINF